MYIELLAIVADCGKSSLDMDNDLGASHFCARNGIFFFLPFFLNEPSPLQNNRVDLSCGVQWRVASGGIVLARSLLNAAECLAQ